jgi:ribosomal protein L40E
MLYQKDKPVNPEDDAQNPIWEPSKRQHMDSSTHRPAINPYAPPPRDNEPTDIEKSDARQASGAINPTVSHPKAGATDDNATIYTDFNGVKDAFCPYCRAELPHESRYCGNCGHLLQRESLEICRQCKAILVPDARFCHQCGSEVWSIRCVATNPNTPLGGQFHNRTISWMWI